MESRHDALVNPGVHTRDWGRHAQISNLHLPNHRRCREPRGVLTFRFRALTECAVATDAVATKRIAKSVGVESFIVRILQSMIVSKKSALWLFYCSLSIGITT